MFTGIVSDVGQVVSVENQNGWLRLSVLAPKTAERVTIGASVSVHGVCLTVNSVADGIMNFSIMPETIGLTNVGDWVAGTKVNLEIPLHIGDELGGHLVYGHVDGRGQILQISKEAESTRLRIGLEPNLIRYVAPKGSISVDGVSLTIAGLGDDYFEVALVEYTLENTTLGTNKVNDSVHIECDMILKYINRLYERSTARTT